ncbi:MAG: ATP-binding protein [Ignavibacteriaceae bacterium]|jgi:hypothetical protein
MNKGKILITEDEEIVAMVTRRMVISLGYDVVNIVSSGEDAIQSAKEQKPDLILMDINLSGEINGIEAAAIINKEYDVPIIFLTASSDEKTISSAIESGPYGYIFKPFELNTLKTTLDLSIYKSKTERKLRESELWWKSSIDSIDQGIITTAVDGSINYINSAAEKILGYRLDECKGMNYLDIYKVYKSVPNELFICAIQDSQNNPEELLNSKWFIDRNNHHIPIEETVSDIKDSNNNFLGKVIVIKDISQKRESQIAVVAARNFYISLLEDFPVPVWRANADGYFNYFNKTWLNLTGRILEQEIYYGWIELIHEEDKEAFQNLFKISFEKKERFECEFRLLNSEKKYSWILAVGTPFYELNKKFAGYIFAGLDLSKKKVLEKELRTAINKAEKASSAKSNFISNMSHEIRTPLNGIVGLTELLFDTELNPDQLQYLEMVKQSSDVLLNLLNNLLNQSKLEAGKEFLHESTFTLHDVIDEIWNPIFAQATLKDLIAEKKWECNFERKIVGDKIKIQQIVLNLLTNALKFTEAGKIELIIINENEIELSETNTTLLNLHIIVKDTGIGIPIDQHERIFESFTQVDSSSTKKYAGVGLGLCIVKNLVDLFHGKIWFESQPGIGSEFHVLLILKYAMEKTSGEVIRI